MDCSYFNVMCFHYSLTKERAAIEIQLQANWDNESWQPVYHADGFTFLSMPVITQEKPATLQTYRWGLVPHWIKTRQEADAIRLHTLNARSETVFEKPSFRSSIMHHRCLVPADGFFEWMDFQKKKYPHHIFLNQHDLFCFAGIYAHWTDQQTGEFLQTFSILTTDANPMMSRIHNLKKRMPVIVPPHLYSTWLQPPLTATDIKSFFSPYPDTDMDNHPISKKISSRTQNSNTPEVLQPFDYPELALAK